MPTFLTNFSYLSESEIVAVVCCTNEIFAFVSYFVSWYESILFTANQLQ